MNTSKYFCVSVTTLVWQMMLVIGYSNSLWLIAVHSMQMLLWRDFFLWKNAISLKPFPPRGPFPSNELPKVMDKDGMYVPQKLQFCCNWSDLEVWKKGVWCPGTYFQSPQFVGKVQCVQRLEQSIADSVQSNVPQTQVPITVVALCKSSIPCLTSLQWP